MLITFIEQHTAVCINGVRPMKNYKLFIITMILISFVMVLISHQCFAVSGNIDELMTDFKDFITSTMIPVTGSLGLALGGLYGTFGSSRGMDIAKDAIIGFAIGAAGPATLLLFV